MVATTAESTAASTATTSTGDNPLPTCPCGHDRHHHRVSRDGDYTTWAWILLMCGISVKPLKVAWRCRVCNVTFDHSTDPAILARRV